MPVLSGSWIEVIPSFSPYRHSCESVIDSIIIEGLHTTSCWSANVACTVRQAILFLSGSSRLVDYFRLFRIGPAKLLKGHGLRNAAALMRSAGERHGPGLEPPWHVDSYQGIANTLVQLLSHWLLALIAIV